MATGSSSRKDRVSKAQQRAASVKDILDVAEALFADLGFFGVTIKDVAHKCGVHPALIHYYFDGKADLFDNVFKRRVQDVLDSRNKSLDQYEAQAGDSLTVEGILKAYYDGAFDNYIKGGDGWRNFGRLFAQVNNAPGYGAEKMDDYFDTVVMRLVKLMNRALPEADPRDLFWGFHFTSGAFTLSLSRTGRIDRLSGGLCLSEDFEAIRDRMSVFMAAGIKAIVERQQAGQPPLTSPPAAGRRSKRLPPNPAAGAEG